MLCGSLDGRGFGGEWIHIYVWLSPLLFAKIITLLMGYTPIQNKKFIFFKVTASSYQDPLVKQIGLLPFTTVY